MQFALLGLDDSTRLLAAASAADPRALVAAYEVDPSQRAWLTERFPFARFGENWDELLSLGNDVVVLVSRGSNEDLRAEQLRKLAQLTVPVVVSHPVLDSMIVHFELEMIRKDSHARLASYVPQAWHPGFDRIAELIDDPQQIGKLDQIVIERRVGDRAAAAVLRHFVRDVHLVRSWIGDLTRVAAFSAGGTTDFGALGVQMTGPTETLVRWSCTVEGQTSAARLTFVGSSGRVVASITDAAEPWQVEMERGEETASESIAPADSRALKTRLLETITGDEIETAWIETCRDMELADAVERSVKKGRTIELYLEEVDEQSTFKGMMAAGGCFLLMGTLFFVVVATTLTHFDVPLARFWPWLLMIVLGGFLGLQFLRLAFPSEPSK